MENEVKKITSWDIRQIKQVFNCDIFFETGLWDPRNEGSTNKALKMDFKKIYTIEIFKKWVDMGNEILKEEIRKGKLEIIHDDSANIEKYIVDNPDIELRTIFFLDAHVDGSGIKNYKRKCPLYHELEGISKLSRRDHIICIDDLRLIKTKCWGDRQMMRENNIIDVLKNKILKINENYKFKTISTSFKDDVLMAYV